MTILDLHEKVYPSIDQQFIIIKRQSGQQRMYAFCAKRLESCSFNTMNGTISVGFVFRSAYTAFQIDRISLFFFEFTSIRSPQGK